MSGTPPAPPPRHRFYDDLAGWWPLISPVDEYAGEAAEFGRVLATAERDTRLARLAQDLAVAVTPDDVARAVDRGLTDSLGARAASFGSMSWPFTFENNSASAARSAS